MSLTKVSSAVLNIDDLYGFRNRIINGDMRIDQRNAGAAVSPVPSGFSVDRFLIFNLTDGSFSAQRDTVAPAGFTNSLKWTTTTADSSLSADQRCGILQIIEGFNTADLGFGTANAQSVAISFWVRSSLTGTFAVGLRNNGAARAYVTSYTISSANTWEYKTITIPGDTSGTWLTDNGVGIQLTWSLGAGSNFQTTAGSWQNGNLQGVTGQVQVMGTLNATWQVTGVQLEAGSVATPFERRPFGTELALCQRYYYRALGVSLGVGFCQSTTQARFFVPFHVPMRDAPSALEQSGTASNYTFRSGGEDFTSSTVPIFGGFASTQNANVLFTVASGLSVGRGAVATSAGNAFLAWSAEL
jgi:hypothetical protein